MPIREVLIRDYADEALPLMRENWAETGFGFEFNPNFAHYIRMQEAGIMFALGAFDDAGKLIGYASAAVIPHPFNPEMVYCATDTLYVVPEYRDTSIGGRLIITTERIAKERGARMVAWHTRAGTPLADVLMARGYKYGDHIVFREI